MKESSVQSLGQKPCLNLIENMLMDVPFSIKLPSTSSINFVAISYPSVFAHSCFLFSVLIRFTLVDRNLIEFNQTAVVYGEGSEAMLNRVMPRDNICLTALLEFKDRSFTSHPNLPQHLLVANTHIHWDPEFCDVKLVQTIMLMTELEAIVMRAQNECGIGVKSTMPGLPGIPIVMCGDLNSLPHSGVLEYIVKGRVPTSHQDFLNCSYDAFFDATIRSSQAQYPFSTHSKSELRHQFRLKNTYMEDQLGYTNFTYDFKGIIDYVFYSGDYLQPLCVLGGVNLSWLQQCSTIAGLYTGVKSNHFNNNKGF